MTESPLLLSTAYLPPASYFQLICTHSLVRIEKYENYTRQTYRNRCHIAGPQGLQALSIPVLRGSFHKVRIDSLGIDYSRRWIHVHTGSINAAYRNSPYFQFYAEDIFSIINRKYPLLVDLTMALTKHIATILGLGTDISFTASFMKPSGDPFDKRYLFHPGIETHLHREMLLRPYIQVFSDKNGFIPDLSIIDLLFNLGPETANYLRSLAPGQYGT